VASSPEQPRRPRPTPAAYRRRRLGGTLIVAVVAIIVVVVIDGGTGTKRLRPAAGPAKGIVASNRPGTPAAAAIQAGLMPWALRSPLSRMNVYPAPGGVVIAGGLSAAQASAAGTYVLNTVTGSLQPPELSATRRHDAAGAVVKGSDVVFGGGSPGTVAMVQSVTNGSSSDSASLPSPRSDATAVTMGATTYIVGGYDGTNATPAVLSTTDGRTFSTVADLPVPVRYPAVAAQGRYLYLFGGEFIGTASAPLAVIERVDPAAHKASVVGRLPYPLEAAAAVNLGGHIYLAGGERPAATGVTPGLGTTQLDGWGTATGTNTGPDRRRGHLGVRLRY
jgi:hypothetical protein